MKSIVPQSFKKVLPASSCGPAFKLCLPSEVVTRSMSQLMDMEFELWEEGTQNCWKVSIGPRRNKAKFEYLLLGWRSVCEQSQMNVGDEVHFFVFDTHMVFSVAHVGAGLAGANPPPANMYTQKPASKSCESSISEDKLLLDELQKLEGCSDPQQIAESSVSEPLGLPMQLPCPSSTATPQNAHEFSRTPPPPGSQGNPRDTLDQVLNLSMGLGVEGLLIGENEEPLLPSIMMSPSLPLEETPPAGGAGNGDAHDMFFDVPASAPLPEQSRLEMEVELEPDQNSSWPFLSRRSNDEASVLWVPHKSAQDSREGKAYKRKYKASKSPWNDANSRELLPFIECCKPPNASPTLSSTKVAAARGLSETPVQGSSTSGQWGNSPQGSVSLNMGEEIMTLKRALLQESARAEKAEEDCMQLFQTMKAAELVVKQQTSLGLEGIGKMYNATDRLVSAKMLHHLDLPKAQCLGAVQVELKHQANMVLEALVQLQALTGCQSTAPRKFEETESTAIPQGGPSFQFSPW